MDRPRRCDTRDTRYELVRQRRSDAKRSARGWEGQARGGGGSGDAGCSTIICNSTIGTDVEHAGAKNCVRCTAGPVAPNSDVSWTADWSPAARSTQVLDPDAALRCIGHAASVPWVHVQTAAWEPAGSDQRVPGLKAANASWPDSQTTTTRPRTRRTRVIENESSLIRASSVQRAPQFVRRSGRGFKPRARDGGWAASPQFIENGRLAAWAFAGDGIRRCQAAQNVNRGCRALLFSFCVAAAAALAAGKAGRSRRSRRPVIALLEQAFARTGQDQEAAEGDSERTKPVRRRVSSSRGPAGSDEAMSSRIRHSRFRPIFRRLR
jgi:hypothetical protein